jgi:outer membrane protein OmpA-like peptidoglycan-associated protein
LGISAGLLKKKDEEQMFNLAQTRGLGDADAVASNDTPQRRAGNSRVELTLAGLGT